MRLTNKLRETVKMIPQSNLGKLIVRSPSNKILPRPPALIVEAIVAIAITELAAKRNPAKIEDYANGN